MPFLNVFLKTLGFFIGITKFIILVPNSRKNPEEEIILTELLRKFGFITPRTSFVKVNHNNLNLNMLFQEKAEKELLEYHLRREGPIFEGDERYRYSINDRAIRAQLARQTNAKWSERSTQHQIISHES